MSQGISDPNTTDKRKMMVKLVPTVVQIVKTFPPDTVKFMPVVVVMMMIVAGKVMSKVIVMVMIVVTEVGNGDQCDGDPCSETNYRLWTCFY